MLNYMKNIRANKNSKLRSLRGVKKKRHYIWKWLMPYGDYLKKKDKIN